MTYVVILILVIVALLFDIYIMISERKVDFNSVISLLILLTSGAMLVKEVFFT